MGEYRGDTAYEQQFIKEFNTLTTRHNRAQVWDDLMAMSACAISNAVDHRKEVWQQREDDYMSITKRYSKEEIDVFPKLLAYIVEALENDRDQDFLGKLYMMMGFGGRLGQFFTPYTISRFMAEILTEPNAILKAVRDTGYVSVNDPCCGAGGMLIAHANVCEKYRNQGVNYQEQVIYVAQDIDPLVAKMCYIQLSLLGCMGYVIVGDSLANPSTGEVLIPRTQNSSDIWFTPMWYINQYKPYTNIGKDVRLSISEYPNVIARVELTEEECYCSIYDLFLHIAAHMGIDVPKGSIFNSNKIYVTGDVQGVLYSYYKYEKKTSMADVMELWGKYGPYIYFDDEENRSTGHTFKAYVEDEFIYNMRINY